MTVADIDVALGALYWRLLHARWEGRDMEALSISDEVDVLLAERYRLTSQPGAVFRARVAR